MAAAREVLKVVEFSTIERAELADGTFGIVVAAASVDEEEPQLLSQEIASARIASMGAALAIIDANIKPEA